MPPQPTFSLEQQQAIARANAERRRAEAEAKTQKAPPAGAMRQMERDTAAMQAKVQQRQNQPARPPAPETMQYIPSFMGVAPPSNMMATPGGMYAPNPNAPKGFSLPNLGQDVFGVTNYALGPYVTAAMAGGAAGAPFGGIGAPVGAAGGMLALGAADLLGGAYNAIVPAFGGSRLTTPSELIRNTMVQANLAKVPETPSERMLYSGLNTAASALPAQQAMNIVGGALKNAPGLIGATGQVLAKPVLPAVTATSAGAGGLAYQAATEMNADPNLAAAIGILGSVATGNLGAPKMPATVAPRTAAQLKALETREYNIAHGQGVEFLPAQVDIVAAQSVRDAVNPNHPQGPVSAAATPQPILDILQDMRAYALNKGRLDSRDLDTYRQKISKALFELEGQEKLVGTRILESLDDYTSNPSVTLNEVRSRVARARNTVNSDVAAADQARNALQTAESNLQKAEQDFNANRTLDTVRARNQARKAFEAAKQTADKAEAKLNTTTTEYLENMRAAKTVDPDMADVNAEFKQAQNDYDAFALRAKNAVDEYDALHKEWSTRSPVIMKQVQDLTTKLNMLLRNDPNAKLIQTRNTQKKINDLTAEMMGLAKRYTDLYPKVMQAQDELEPITNAVKAAKQRVDDKLAQLTQNDDVVMRVNQRNAALEAGRKLHPTRLLTEAFEAMPGAAALSTTGIAGRTTEALRQEVRSFVSRMGKDFKRLPSETQRQIQKFMRGGGVTQSILQSLGSLSPGFGRNSELGNAFSALMTAIGFAAGGMPGSAMTLLGTTAATQAARGMTNRTAIRDFNRLRDIVSMGAGAPQPVPRSDVQNMLAYLLAQGTQQEPPR